MFSAKVQTNQKNEVMFSLIFETMIFVDFVQCLLLVKVGY